MSKRRSFLRAALIVLGAAPPFASVARAVEYGLSNYQLGLVLPLAGYTPPPGVYFWNSFFLYQGSGPLYRHSAVRSPSQVTYKIPADIAIFAWFTDVTLFGGELGFASTNAFGSETTTIATPYVDAFGIGRHLEQEQTITGFADTELTAMLGWHAGEQHWRLAVSGFVPTGNYDGTRIAQTSLNRPALDIKGAYTFLSLKTGLEASAALGVTVNGVNTATNYQSGAELHFEWSVSQFLPFGLSLGVGGYFYQQITGDSGAGDIFGSFKGRVAAVGPIATYTLKVGAQKVDFDVRWFHEFAAYNRVRVDSIYATLGFPLWSEPPAVLAAK